MTDDIDEVASKRLLRRVVDNHSRLALNDVLNTHSGRLVLSDILKACDLFAHIPTDQYKTFRALGRRDVGLWLRNKLLTADADSVILMENESHKRDEELKT